MRRLILAGFLGLTMPALAAAEITAPAEVAPTPAPEKANIEVVVPAVEPERVEVTPERPPVPSAAIARGTFTTAVEQREPVDSITLLGSDQDRVFYFSEFVGLTGRRLTHRWEHRGEVVAEVPIAIGGPRWRAYSMKSLDASQLGEWTVTVVDESGRVVHSNRFVYEPAAPTPEIAAPMALPEAPPATTDAPEATPTVPAAVGGDPELR